MARFTAPEHTSGIELAGVPYVVVEGILEVPDEIAGHPGLMSNGFTRAPDVAPMAPARAAIDKAAKEAADEATE